MSFVKTSSLVTAVVETRGDHGWSLCTSAENRADLEKVIICSHISQLVLWNGLVLDRHENSVIRDREDGQGENDQRGTAVQTIFDLGQGGG